MITSQAGLDQAQRKPREQKMREARQACGEPWCLQDAGGLLAGWGAACWKARMEAARMLISLISAFLALKHSSCHACLSFFHENLMRWFLLLYVVFLNLSEAVCGSHSVSPGTGTVLGVDGGGILLTELRESCTVSHSDGPFRGP